MCDGLIFDVLLCNAQVAFEQRITSLFMKLSVTIFAAEYLFLRKIGRLCMNQVAQLGSFRVHFSDEYIFFVELNTALVSV